ncbi:MAG: prolyl oligopeptidase family serine peptidase [Firmicutes bacterium]|nr:prolyl oligopeptidase family serine peptidase [Bacillota bacterium]
MRAGFVVLAMDPLGQGERMQYVDPQTGQLVVNWGTTEHSHAGLQCTLTGANIARYFVHDAVRAVDYLCTRQEVDPNRIGVTGNSGGGTQTSYLLMVDQRIKVGVPCTYITSREHYLQTGQAHDAEQNLYGAVSEGINYDDFVTAIAPNPVMIGAVASDFFVIEGTLQSAKRARHVYQLYQRPENFRLVVAPGIHRYASLLRREAVKWFQYHLMGIGSQLEDVIVTDPLEHWETITSQRDFTEEQDEGFALEPLPDQELWCTESGQVYIDQPKAPKVFHFNREASQSAPPLTNPREVLRQAVLGERVRNPLWVRCLDSGREGDLEWHQVFFFTEPGIAVSGIWVTADAKAAPWLVLSEEGTEVLATNPAGIADLAREKGRLFLFDVRGIGAVKQRPINPRDYSGLYGTEFVLNYNAIMLKDSLVWMRAYDVLRALEYVQGVTGQSPSLVAYDWLGPIALAAVAAWDNTVAQMEYHRLLADLTSVIDTELHLCEHRLEAFDLARILDIPGLLAQYRDSVTVKSSVDGRGRLRTSAS